MREILEDALVVYRHEAESLLIVAAPAVILGPILILVAAAGLRPAFLSIPLLLSVYLAVYTASLRAAKLLLDSEEPDPGRVYLGILPRLPGAVVTSTPVAVIVFVTAASGMIVADQGFSWLAFGIGLAGMFVALAWVAKHAYDLPLVVAYGVGGFESLQAGRNVYDVAPAWSSRVFVATSLPLAVTWMICWGLWAILSPAFGAVVFAAVAALWLPFASLAFVGACSRLVTEEQPTYDSAVAI